MASFSASDAALTGFRIVRERPRAALVWAAAQLVFSFCSMLALVKAAGPVLTKLADVASFRHMDAAQAAGVIRQVLPLYLWFVLIGLAFYPVLYAAMNRAVLRPEEDRFGYLRLGFDELRQLGLLLLAIAVGILFNIALIVLIIILAIVFAIIIHLIAHSTSSGANPATLLIPFILYVCLIGAWIFVYVRLSLASPMTFATRRVNLFGSWRLTRGRFWAIFGAYLIAWALGLVVMLLTFMITLAITVLSGGGVNAATSMFHPDMSSLSAYLTPARLISFVIGSIASALVWPVVLTPPAAIYQALTQSDPA